MRSTEERGLGKKEAERWGYAIQESDIEEQRLIKASGKDKKSNPSFLYFVIDANLPHKILRVWRGDSQPFTAIFNDGFVSRGTNRSLYLHVFPGESSSLGINSGFISTATVMESALRFPLSFPKREMIHNSFVYEITPSQEGRDVLKEIPKLARSKEDLAFYEVYCKRENEIAFLHKIRPEDIKGAWPVEVYQGGLILPERITKNGFLSTGYYRLVNKEHGAYIANPNYIEPVIPNLNDINYNPRGAYLWNAAKYAGYGMTGLGAVLDAHSLYSEYRYSQQKKDFTNTYAEASRIAGGWASASRLGLFSAQKALVYSAPLSPLGQTMAVVISGMAGSAIGYYFGGEGSQWLYNLNRRDDLIKPLYSERIDTDTLRGTITILKDGARIGRFTTKKSDTQPRQKQYFSSLMTNIQAPANTDPAGLYLNIVNQQGQSVNQLFQPVSVSITRSADKSVSNQSLQKSHNNAVHDNAVINPQSIDHRDLYLAMTENMNAINSLQHQTLTLATRQENNTLISQTLNQTPDIQRLQANLEILREMPSLSPQSYSSSTCDILGGLSNLNESREGRNYSLTANRCENFSQFTRESRQNYYFGSAAEAARYTTFFSNYISGNFRETPPPVNNFSFWSGREYGDSGKSGYCDAFGSCYESSTGSNDCRDSGSGKCESSLFN